MAFQGSTRRWRTLASLVFALALVISMFGVAAASQHPGEQGGPEKGPDHPACDNPGDGPEWCDEDNDEEPAEPDPDEGCDEDDYTGIQDTGVASGIVNEVKTGAEDGGAPEELTEGIDTINCEVIVTIENATDGDEGEDDDEGDDENSENGDGECTSLVDAFEENGAPAELTDGLRQLCDAIEGNGNGDDEDEGDEGNPVSDGCDTLVDELSANVDEAFEEAGALCDGLEAVPSPL